MADRIKLLADSVANQIAAGEVVNRPASVVKELMENAVDAGATSVTLNFRDGGRELIQIKDDGCGMSPQDARLAFERHATSKIASVDDIYSLTTFGFRGEALASIAAVAQVEMHTRQQEAELGTRLNIDGGTFAGQSAVAAPQGTQILIRNLFYNVPARKKFLDKGTAEATHIVSEFQRVALVHPGIAFQLYRDDSTVFNLPAGTLLQRILGVIGKGAASKLLEVTAETSIIRVHGFIGRPSSARQRNREQFMFVNGRYFRSPFFHKAIVQAYEKLIPQSVQPSYFIYLETYPEQIDVNVHPQKTEVKFSNQSAVWQIINAAVRETLAKSGAVPMMDFDSEERIEIPPLSGLSGTNGGSAEEGGHRYSLPVREPAVVRSRDYNPFACRDEDTEESELRLGRPAGSEQAGVTEFEYVSRMDGGAQSSFDRTDPLFEGPRAFSGVLNIGEGYAVALWGGVFVAIDLRRAREAVLYDRFRAMISGGASATQQLLFPERMVFSADDFLSMRDHSGEFEALGFDVRTAGEHAIEIFGIPADMPLESLDEAVYGMLDELRDGTFEGERSRRERLAAVMARAGGRVAANETESLLAALATLDNPSFTPGGKSVMVPITIEEIKNKLK